MSEERQASPITIEAVSFRYGDRLALDTVSFDVHAGEIFALLGPNGGGKTTLFKLLSTLNAPQEGRISVAGFEVTARRAEVRRSIGVVFQHPSLDAKLSVRENLIHQGHLYGLKGNVLKRRIDELLMLFQLGERARDRVEKLSGGLARRVDLAKGLLHQPSVLLLDEPSTGLDPQARFDFWKHLDRCRREQNLTVLMTTHYMSEADRCDRVGIIDQGRLVVVGSPEQLKSEISGECLHVEGEAPDALARDIAARFKVESAVVDGRVRIERERAHAFIPELVEAFPERIRAVSLTQPTLEEVFVHHTGRKFEEVDRGHT